MTELYDHQEFHDPSVPYEEFLRDSYYNFFHNRPQVIEQIATIRTQAVNAGAVNLGFLGMSIFGKVYRPLGSDSHFPGNYHKEDSSILPAELVSALEETINNDLDAVLDGTFSPTGDERTQESCVGVFNGVLVGVLKNKGWDQWNLTPLQMTEAVRVVDRAAASLREALAAQFYLGEAARIIGMLAPKLQHEILQISKSVVILRQNRKTFKLKKIAEHTDGHAIDFSHLSEYWMAFPSDDIHFIRINDTFSMMDYSAEKVLRVLFMVHELMHVYVNILFTKYLPSIQEEVSNNQTNSLVESNEPVPLVGIRRVLDEAMSLAVEAEFLIWLKDNTLSDSLKRDLKAYSDQRISYLRQSNHLWIDKNRAQSGKTPLPTHQYKRLAYSEGATLSISLRRRGWTLDDLPEFIRRVVELAKQEAPQSQKELFDNFPLSRPKRTRLDWLRKLLRKNVGEQQTPYTSLLRKIRHMTKQV